MQPGVPCGQPEGSTGGQLVGFATAEGGAGDAAAQVHVVWVPSRPRTWRDGCLAETGLTVRPT